MTEEVELQLGNFFTINSGWVDHDDPAALECGGYVRIENPQGREVHYVEASDFAGLTTDEAAAKLFTLLLACQGRQHEALDLLSQRSPAPGSESG